MKLFIFSLLFIYISAVPYPKNTTWTNVVIGGGGFIPGLVFNPSQKGLAYLRTDIGGLYRLNNDQSWTPITDFSTQNSGYLGAESVATDPKDPNRVYYAAGLYTEDWWNSNGSIFSSTDQGTTWAVEWKAPFKMGANDDGRSAGERLAVNPLNNSIILYCSQQHGLWRSSDFGVSFSQVTSFPVPSNVNDSKGVVFVLYYYPFDTTANTIIVGVDDINATVYKSTDGGDTWKVIPGQPTGFYPHHGAFTSDGKYFIITLSNGPGPNSITNGAVYRLEIATGQWTDISPLEPGKNGQPTFGFAGLAVDNLNPNTIMVSTIDRWNPVDDVLRSTDAGQTWKSVSATASMNVSLYPYLNWGASSPRFGWWMGMVKIDPFDSNRAFFGTGATLYACYNLEDIDSGKPTFWSPQIKGVEEVAVLDLVVPTSGPTILHSAMMDLGGFSHTDLTVSPKQGMWQDPIFTTGSGVDCSLLYPNIVVRVGLTSNPASCAVSDDYGVTWKAINQPLYTNGGGSVQISIDAKVIVWTPAERMPYYSFDNGSTWNMSKGFPTLELQVRTDKVAPNVFYAYDPNNATVYVSTDYAQSFTQVSTGKNFGYSLEVSYAAKGDLWIPTWTGLLRSTDGGATFDFIKGISLAENIGFGKAYEGSNYPTIFIAGIVNNVYGVYGSIDEGETWSQLNDDNHQWGSLQQKISPDQNVFGRVFIATNGRGIIMGS